MNCLSKDVVQLLDLPDELILAIMNKVQPHVLLLCSIIDIGNDRLERLVLDKCQTIDLTFDFFQSPHTLDVGFYSIFRRRPLFSAVHQFTRPNETTSEILSSFCFSPVMHSIVSFELDDACILPSIFDGRELYFPQSNQLTHIRITFLKFH